VRCQAGGANERLKVVREAYAFIAYQHHNTELAALLHQGEHVARAQQHSALIQVLLIDGVKSDNLHQSCIT